MDDDDYRPYVTERDGQIILVDPVAHAVATTVNKMNCRNTVKMHADRILHFVNRMRVKQWTPEQMVMTLINVDSRYGAEIADLLMPGHDWDEYRKRGEVPYARGLARRDGMQQILDDLDPYEGKRMRFMQGLVIWVLDYDTVTVFPFSMEESK